MKLGNIIRFKASGALCIYEGDGFVQPLIIERSETWFHVRRDEIEFVCENRKYKKQCLSCKHRFFCFTSSFFFVKK